MIEIGARLSELEALGLSRRTRLVSGPQGPRVVLDGKPVLALCSANYLGLADHPQVREAAAEAAMRWGAGAGGSRLGSGTMTIHRRLEDRLAGFLGRQAALLFGSGFLAGAGTVAVLARPGDVVFTDERSQPSILAGCRIAGAETFLYEHLDVDHLAWGIAKAEGRGVLIATDSVFAADGETAPLAEIVELAHRRRVRLLVDESHAIGVAGPSGRGLLAEAGLTDQVDVVLGSLAASLGSYGAFVACDRDLADHLLNAAPTLLFSSAPAPAPTAAALAALSLLEERPQLVTRLRANTTLLRHELKRDGFAATGRAAIVSVFVGAPELAERLAAAALAQGVFIEAVRPPAVPAAASCLRLTPMASHRPAELREAAQVVAAAARQLGFAPPDLAPELEEPEFGDVGSASPVFDFEQSQRLAA